VGHVRLLSNTEANLQKETETGDSLRDKTVRCLPEQISRRGISRPGFPFSRGSVMPRSMSLFVLVLAGGSGERFWPLSRRARPKQLLSLFGKESLLEATLRRLEGLVPPERILILTNAEQEKGVRELAPQLPAENIVAEPAKRDTAAAIALGAAWVAARDPRATMAVLPADHLIKDTAGFQETLRTAQLAAERGGDLVTVGIQPTWACPGFGYIELGTRQPAHGGAASPPVFEVIRFREKPNAELAETFLKQGNFRWNAGMFIWTIPTILSAFNRHAPVLSEFINRLHGANDFGAAIEQLFPDLPKISIDYAVMEKAGRVLTVEAAFDWDDVGGWTAVAKYFKQDADGNSANTATGVIDAAGNIVFSERKAYVGLLGVQNLIIVETDDALLICDKHEAERIKQLVAAVPRELQ
jgi:mannose-1-phosphate guanylyltransferase